MRSQVSPRLLALLEVEPLAAATALDVGTGRGRLALALAPRCRHVVGIDRNGEALEAARRRAAMAGTSNVDFRVSDAERDEYAQFHPNLVVAHLCMSDAIVERAARALAPGDVFAFVAFHAEQWRETGRRSRFSYSESQMATLLERTGFRVEFLEVERDVRRFDSVEEGRATASEMEERWRADGRWAHFVEFLEAGGRTLTRAHLVIRARRR